MNRKNNGKNKPAKKEKGKLSALFTVFYRYVLSFLACLLLLYFGLSLLLGLDDVGNLVGIAICLFYLFWIGTPFSIAKLKEKISANKVGKKIMLALTIFVAVCACYAIVVSGFMLNAANRAPQAADTTLIVLGCKVDGTSPSKSLYRRLLAAEAYLKENPKVNCVVSGGQGPNEGISEARCMYNYLTQNGIEPSRIHQEDKSTNTDENIRFSKSMIKQQNLSENITIVTDGYHQLRASIIAKKNGVTISGAVSANTPLEVLLSYWIREWIAIPVSLLK